MNELWEKIAKKKAQMLPPFETSVEEIQKKSEDVLALTKVLREKTKELKTAFIQKNQGVSDNIRWKNDDPKTTLRQYNNNEERKRGFKCTACGQVYNHHLPHCGKCGSPFLKFTDAEDGTFWGTGSKVEGYGSNKGPCYIATAVYGDYNAPEVNILRAFRDNKLMTTAIGRLFVKVYYSHSPSIANKLKDYKKVNVIVRKWLDRFVIYCQVLG